MSTSVRPYSPADRDAIRYICCETGFSGNPIDPLFSDREVFADFLTRYYTDWEPESSWVAEVDGRVVGYLLACARYRYHKWAEFCILASLVPKVLWRLIRGRYDAPTKKYLQWCLTNGRKETPAAPKQSAHFHFNILPEYRNSGLGMQLVKTMVNNLRARGVKQVYGQIQTFEDRRTERVFNKYDFHTLDRREVTKFQDYIGHKVYLSTMVLDLTGNSRLFRDAAYSVRTQDDASAG